MATLPRVAVIGAGSSGIAATKALHAHGFEVDCFEKGDRVGGNWVFGNSNGMSSAYRSLHINTSRARMAYADFPMPDDYPDFPHHAQIARYFDDYVTHFGVRERIRFGCGVRHAALHGGAWDLELDDGGHERYDALLVANGHHWDARWPDPPFAGTFDGTVLHSHQYVDASAWAGKRVVVLGMGNSAMDIAVEASLVAERTFLAARRGAHIIPKYVLGRPVDQLPNDPRIPWRIRRRILELIVHAATGDITRLGLPRPDHRLADAHPTISDQILSRITHGEVTPKPNIARLCGDRIEFTDGSVERADVVVYCTGYNVSFPFFDPAFIAARGNELPLFMRVFHPDIASVFFIALLQPLGATMPLAELQGEWIAEHLAGRYALPPRDQLLARIRADREAVRKRYVASPRHTMQVDFDDYVYAVQKERAAGRRRATGALPVAARVATPA